MTTDELRRLDKAHVWHPFTPMSVWLESDPLVITGAQGFYLIASDGKWYLDGVSSLWCNVHGHRVPEIDRAIREQLERVAHTTMLGLASEPAIRLAEELVNIAPAGLTKVFYSDAGATATEIAFKLAVQYWYNIGRPEKREFIAFTEAYHGDTLGAISVGRMPAFHKPYLPLMFKVHFAPTPYEYRWQDLQLGDAANSERPPSRSLQGAANPGGVQTPSPGRVDNASAAAPRPPRLGEGGGEGLTTHSDHPALPHTVKQQSLAALRHLLNQHAHTIAGICIEPIVQGAGGMIIQPPGFLAEVRKLADQYDVLLICDEVATGFARTGKMFAVEHENVQPDLMTVAKGLTGGYLPLAATLATQKIFDAFLGHPSDGRTFFHGHTFTGNPLACAAAIANLELMRANDTVGNVARNAPKLAEMLVPLKGLKHVGEIRQKGYMVGIELVQDKATRAAFDPARRVGHAVCAKVREQGVIVRPLGDVVVLMPPPAMGEEEIGTIVEAVRFGIEECLGVKS